MKRSNRLVTLGAIALAVVVLLSLIAAPSNSKLTSGSTYSRAADGYGAWYAFMQQQGVSIQRWQKPDSEIKAQKSPVTLLQVYSTWRSPTLDIQVREWVEKGNTLVILGVRQPVTGANFSTMQKSAFGEVKIDTRRRYPKSEATQVLLGDRFGAIVWEEEYGQGKVIYCTTPYLAANAYQDYLSNFKYLADLVKQTNHSIFVDEYIHGYKDADVREKEGQGDLFSYLAKTPIVPILLQAGVLLLVLIWAENRRFGKPVPLDTPTQDNSEAYIQALAGVLHKAKATDFVVEMVGKEEQLQLQKALGLGTVPLKPETLMNAWVEKTGASAAELNTVLKVRLPKALRSAQSPKHPITEPELISWLGKWRRIRLHKSAQINHNA